MSILIKGMEMPNNCEECHLESYCTLWVKARILCGEKFEDPKSRIKATIRHPDCPLVYIPPHDRLIDADVLMRKLELIDWHSANKKGEMVEGARSEEEAYIKYTDAECAINDAPTIIEGESSL